MDSFIVLLGINDSGQNRIWRVQGCKYIRNCESHFIRLLFTPYQVHEPSFSLDNIVKSRKVGFGTKVSISRHWTIYKLRIVSNKYVIVNVEFLSDSWDKVFKHDVWLLHKFVEHLAALRVFEIKSEAFFVAVDWLEIGGCVIVPWRSPESGRIPLWRLDFDDLATEPCEDWGRVRSHNYSW